MLHPALPKHLTLTGRPLLLMPSVLNELHARLQTSYTPHTAKLADRIFRRASAQSPEPSADLPPRILATRIAFAGSSLAPAIAQPDPYFAHITIEGPLLNKAAMWGEAVCVDGYDRIAADISAAMHDSDCAGILLDIDSPGGMVNGCFELSDKIGDWAKSKPIVAHTSGLLCSAAYALAAQCSEVHSALTATVGSIGVIYGRYDYSAAMEKEGLKVDYITSGEQKSWGHPETVMSEAELTTLQDEINTLAGLFFDRVATGRNMTTEDVSALEAGAFLTATAKTHGLVDSQTDLSGALTRLTELASNPTPPSDPIPAPAPEAAAVSKKTAAKQSTENKETPMSKSPARHRASLKSALLGAASTMAQKLAMDDEDLEAMDDDAKEKAMDDEAESELDAMDEEDITSMDEDEDVSAMDDDEDLEAMDDDELDAHDKAMDEEEAPDASAKFRASASRIAHAVATSARAAAAPAPKPTGDAVKDAVAADRRRSADIMALPAAKGREATASKLAEKGLSVEDAKDILAASPKASKRTFNPPSPKLGTGKVPKKGSAEESPMLAHLTKKREAAKK